MSRMNKYFNIRRAERMLTVAANHENDTCFGNGLVMGSADCMYYAGLVKVAHGALCTLWWWKLANS